MRVTDLSGSRNKTSVERAHRAEFVQSGPRIRSVKSRKVGGASSDSLAAVRQQPPTGSRDHWRTLSGSPLAHRAASLRA